MPPADHDTLVRSATGGDPIAVDALLERHLPGLMAYVRLHLGRELAQKDAPIDFVQSVCRDVLLHARDFVFQGEGAFRNWLYQKAIAKIRDRQRYWHAKKRDQRRESRRTVYALRSMDGSPSDVAMREEDMQRLESAMAELTEEHRQVVTLAYVVGLTRREIAAEMDRSETAVRSLLHRALARVGFLMSDPRELGLEEAGAQE